VEAGLHEEIRHLREKDVDLEQLIHQLREQQAEVATAGTVLNSAMEERFKLGEDTVEMINQRIEKLEAEASQLSGNDATQVINLKIKCFQPLKHRVFFIKSYFRTIL
jgi:predicted nuclease with TOPRIM domain